MNDCGIAKGAATDPYYASSQLSQAKMQQYQSEANSVCPARQTMLSEICSRLDVADQTAARILMTLQDFMDRLMGSPTVPQKSQDVAMRSFNANGVDVRINDLHQKLSAIENLSTQIGNIA